MSNKKNKSAVIKQVASFNPHVLSSNCSDYALVQVMRWFSLCLINDKDYFRITEIEISELVIKTCRLFTSLNAPN